MWGLEENCSHFAMICDEAPNPLRTGFAPMVVHSDLYGVRAQPSATFFQTHDIVYTFRVKLSPYDALRVSEQLHSILRTEKDPYDFAALSYFAYRVLLKRLFGRPLPELNPWGMQHAFLCTELAYLANELIAATTGRLLFPPTRDRGMLSPQGLYHLLINEAKGTNVLDFRNSHRPPLYELSA